MPRVIFASLFCFGTLSAMVSADDPAQVNDTAVRDAVSRSLPFLEKEGVAWMEDHGCMSCHHVPLVLWSHRSAQAQGFTVDFQKLAEWDEWTRKDSLANRLLFRLRNYDLGRPEAAALPQAVKDKLKPLIARPSQFPSLSAKGGWNRGHRRISRLAHNLLHYSSKVEMRNIKTGASRCA